MSIENMSKLTKTDWKRLAEMTDKDIDTSDIFELGDRFFRKAKLRCPPKDSVAIPRNQKKEHEPKRSP